MISPLCLIVQLGLVYSLMYLSHFIQVDFTSDWIQSFAEIKGLETVQAVLIDHILVSPDT